MILYHGTNVEFDVIDLTKSKPNKDFGRGFYLSDNYEQALNMAKTKVEQFEVGLPIVMKYEVDDNVFQTFRVLQFKEYTKEWAQFILQNRNNSTQQQVHDYDIVIGLIANDRVGVQLWRYNSHSIDLDTLMKNLRYMHGITIQYFFGTEQAIQQLKRI